MPLMAAQNRFQFAGLRVPNPSGAVLGPRHDIAAVPTEHGRGHGFSVPRKNPTRLCLDVPDPGGPIVGCRHYVLAGGTKSNAPYVCVVSRNSAERLALIESPHTHRFVCGGRH